jgi:hypothetical protein
MSLQTSWRVLYDLHFVQNIYFAVHYKDNIVKPALVKDYKDHLVLSQEWLYRTFLTSIKRPPPHYKTTFLGPDMVA